MDILAQIALDDEPLAEAPVYAPLPDVKLISITKGRQSSVGRVEAGRCTIILLDEDRRYDPTNTASQTNPNPIPQTADRRS
jgi:hypothetical protein